MSSNSMSFMQAQVVLEELIRFNTISHLSNHAISEHVAECLRTLGFDVEVTTYTDRKGVLKVNLVAKREPLAGAAPSELSGGDEGLSSETPASLSAGKAGTTPGGLAYFCHTDVVPADRWSGPGGDPFKAVVQGDRLYGRGACDMKGSLAAMLQAAASVLASEQTEPLWIVCTADEEVGFEGAKDLVQCSKAYREIVAANPVCIIGEPTELQVVHAHKGIMGLRVESRGKAAHSSTGEGINANLAMVPMLETMRGIDEQCRIDPGLRDERFDPPTLTWNFGVSDGMSSVNIVPDHCVAWACFRTMPGVDGLDFIDTVKQRADELGIEFKEFSGGPPLETPVDSPCVEAMCELAESVIGPNQPARKCYATDGCIFEGLTKRIVCGPGSINQAHTTDEYIELDQLEKGVSLYKSAIRRFC